MARLKAELDAEELPRIRFTSRKAATECPKATACQTCSRCSSRCRRCSRTWSSPQQELSQRDRRGLCRRRHGDRHGVAATSRCAR